MMRNKTLYKNSRNYRSRETESTGKDALKYRVTDGDRIRTALRSGPVKTWADMTPEERAKVLDSLKGRKP